MRKTLSDLLKNVTEKLDGLEYKDVERVVDKFLDEIKEAMVDGELVIRGFAKFFTSNRDEKKARNPHTGEEVIVPSRTVPRCKFSGAFSRDVKDGNVKSELPAASVEPQKWYVAINGQPEGPFDCEEIKKMVKDCKINTETLVYSPELGSNWVSLKDTEFSLSTVPPLPPQPKTPPIPKTA